MKPVVIDKAHLKFEQGQIPNGSEALYAVSRQLYAPIGFIWYRQILIDHTDIAYIFVHECCRRQGIATAMLNELGGWYPQNTIYTTCGNELSEPWLRAMGFQLEKRGWFKTLQTPATNPSP